MHKLFKRETLINLNRLKNKNRQADEIIYNLDKLNIKGSYIINELKIIQDNYLKEIDKYNKFIISKLPEELANLSISNSIFITDVDGYISIHTAFSIRRKDGILLKFIYDVASDSIYEDSWTVDKKIKEELHSLGIMNCGKLDGWIHNIQKLTV